MTIGFVMQASQIAQNWKQPPALLIYIILTAAGDGKCIMYVQGEFAKKKLPS
jgi:hypothetical protein